MRRLYAHRFPLGLIVLMCCGTASAQDDVQMVGLFAAMEAGQINVKFIPADAAKANVLIENLTKQVLHVQLPDAIAAVPVLAQLGQGANQNAGPNGGAAPQGVGGGLNAGRGQGFGNAGGNHFGAGAGQREGLGMGFMRIEPEKTRKLTATTVCLEHGKPDPHPRIAYRLIPIETLTANTQVTELCRQLGRDQIAQRPAQGAAWHLANGLSWDELAEINQLESRYVGNIKFFKPAELTLAREFVETLSANNTTQDNDASTP